MHVRGSSGTSPAFAAGDEKGLERLTEALAARKDWKGPFVPIASANSVRLVRAAVNRFTAEGPVAGLQCKLPLRSGT